MSQKGLETRKEILSAAKKLFTKKGFTAVTMSDICERTQLSRGGLYRHFASVKDIFVALLTEDRDSWENDMNNAMRSGFPAAKMLSYYFQQVYEDTLQKGGRLSLAVYEFERSGQDKGSYLKKRYGYAVDMMTKLLQYGQTRKEFTDFDAHTLAEHIVIFTDGLKMAGAGVPLSDKTIKRQLDRLYDTIERKEIK